MEAKEVVQYPPSAVPVVFHSKLKSPALYTRGTKCGHTSLIDTPAINPLLSSPGQPRAFPPTVGQKNENLEQQATLMV